ncbi:MAG: N-acetyl sugar amidotransferase [Alphaproteobacteria bacterium]|nr:N-acetyl sugar amidotransferase [Alphaproteobacteria bacterium]
MNRLKNQRCSRCVMDASDPDITFNANGICNHCVEFDGVTRQNWFPNEEGKQHLARIVERIKVDGQGKEYDCIIGLSGGVDSSYLALEVAEWGLRPLVIHVDAGWNSELAVANIEKIVTHCMLDLHTHVVDWEEMRDLHLAYLRSGYSNQDVPQDHVFFASLYHFATKNRIRYILSGGNLATEGVFPTAWHGGSAMDAINLRAINKKFGERSLRTYNTISFFEYYIWYPFVKKIRTVRPLNFMPYDKKSAITNLERLIGWRSYGRKHGESLFTKVFQNDYLPRKFGYDKRLPHFSSLIVSEQMTREEAMAKLDEPLYDSEELEIDLNYFCKKLRISREQYEDFITGRSSQYTDYPNWLGRHRLLKSIQARVESLLGRRINIYS